MNSAAFPVLGPGEIHFWSCPLDAPDPESFARWLSPDEKERRERFLLPDLRRRYAVARGALRRLAGRYAGRSPEELVFTYGKHGKPALEGVFFNLSHSADRMAVVFSADGPVGLDIEQISPRLHARKIAARYFLESERREMETPDEEEFLRRFFRLWTAKEAVMKATGEGFALNIAKIEIGLFPLKLVSLDWGGEKNWELREVIPAEGFVGALVSRPGRELRRFSGEDFLKSPKE